MKPKLLILFVATALLFACVSADKPTSHLPVAPPPRPQFIQIPTIKSSHCDAVRVSDVLGKIVGSGFIIEDGLVITAFHVIEGEPLIFVNGINASCVYSDMMYDVAILSCPTLKGSARIRNPVLGEEVVSVGYFTFETESIPLRLTSKIAGMGADHIFLDGGTQPGMSGAPVYGKDGCVVGIVVSCLMVASYPNFAITGIRSGELINNALIKAKENAKASLQFN